MLKMAQFLKLSRFVVPRFDWLASRQIYLLHGYFAESLQLSCFRYADSKQMAARLQ
jgi:hypothetical protein